MLLLPIVHKKWTALKPPQLRMPKGVIVVAGVDIAHVLYSQERQPRTAHMHGHRNA